MGLFSGQTYLVTGASGGVGGAIARLLGQEGATVCLGGRDRARLQQVAAGIPGGRSRSYPADLTKDEEFETSVADVLRENPRVDGLIHCAAIIEMDEIAHASTRDFDRQLKINVVVPFRLTKRLLPSLLSSQGQVVFINSSVGLTSRPGMSQYAATKHALKALADGLRDECNPGGVRVCSIYLGATATPMQEEVRAQQDRGYNPDRLIQPHDVAGLVSSVLALPRTAEITDVTMRPMRKT